MVKILVSMQNGLLAESITQMLQNSDEFQAVRIVNSKNDSLVSNCKIHAADILLAEVSYASDTTIDKRLVEVKDLRKDLPDCKVVFMCDENSSPEIAKEVMNAKKDGIIDAFFYSSVTAGYLIAALEAL